LPPYIDHVISLYPWERYAATGHLESFLEVAVYDSTRADFDFDQIDLLARWVNSRRARGNVLVHCQAGLNRSGLVVARALMLDEGVSADQAIASLRERRSPAVLCNELFEAWLCSHDEWGGHQEYEPVHIGSGGFGEHDASSCA
jgi:protein-tyrosine phosphatase